MKKKTCYIFAILAQEQPNSDTHVASIPDRYIYTKPEQKNAKDLARFS